MNSIVNNIITDKGKRRCAISTLIILICYGSQRFISLLSNPNGTILLTEALLFSAAVAVVYFIDLSSDETFYALLVAVFGFRMMPPSIGGLGSFSKGGEIVYYIVTKASVLLFSFLIIRLYRRQKVKKINALSLLCLMFAVPFSMEVGRTLSSYTDSFANGNKLYGYFICYAFYAAALIFTLILARISDGINGKFIADYTLFALLINICRNVCVVVVYMSRDYHVSRSYYGWFMIYVFFFIVFYIMRDKKIKEAKGIIKNEA